MVITLVHLDVLRRGKVRKQPSSANIDPKTELDSNAGKFYKKDIRGQILTKVSVFGVGLGHFGKRHFNEFKQCLPVQPFRYLEGKEKENFILRVQLQEQIA